MSTGCSAAWVAHCFREAGVGGSNPLIPTKGKTATQSARSSLRIAAESRQHYKRVSARFLALPESFYFVIKGCFGVFRHDIFIPFLESYDTINQQDNKLNRNNKNINES